jgi:hypothetical protein
MVIKSHKVNNLLELESENFIRACYRTLLLRDPDSAGLINYHKHLSEGLSKESIILALADSQEGRSAKTLDSNEVRQLKRIVWMNSICFNVKLKLGIISKNSSFINYIDKERIILSYELFLGRKPLNEEINSTIEYNITMEDLLLKICNSEEFFNVNYSLYNYEK